MYVDVFEFREPALVFHSVLQNRIIVQAVIILFVLLIIAFEIVGSIRNLVHREAVILICLIWFIIGNQRFIIKNYNKKYGCREI